MSPKRKRLIRDTKAKVLPLTIVMILIVASLTATFVILPQDDIIVKASSPTVSTNATTSITTTTATLNGYLSDDGGEGCSVWFEYGETDSYGSTVSPYQPDLSSGEHTIVENFWHAQSVYACDVDGDSDIDVLGAAEGDSKITWWENDGSESFTEHTIVEHFWYAQSVYACDVDGDSDIDVLGAGKDDDEIAWFENDGSESFTEHTIDASFGEARDVYACDVDSDGDIDVLGAAYSDDDITWWENDGSESFTKHTIDGSFSGAWSVYATDVDGDSDIDVLGAASDADDITWWENDGSESFTKHTIDASFDGARSVYACDVDGDSDIDILGAASDADDITWWENDGSESFTEHTIDGSFNGAISVYATDIDGDSDIDVLGTALFANDITWWENDGNESFTEHTIDGSFSYAISVYATDVDGDGDIDVLGAAVLDNEITWWENNQSKNSPLEFSYSLTGLTPGTTYHYRSVANNSDGESYGDDMTFTTDALPPSVSTNASTNVDVDSATLNGYLSDDGGSNCSVWFQYGETDSYGNTVNYFEEDDTEDSFSSSGASPNEGSLANMHDEDWDTSGGLKYESSDDAGTKTMTVYEDYNSVTLVDKFGVTVKFAQWELNPAGFTSHDFDFFIYNFTSSSWEKKLDEGTKPDSIDGIFTKTFEVLNANHYINTTNNNQVKTKAYMKTISSDSPVSPYSGHVEYYESKLTGFIFSETSFNATLTGLSPGTTYHYRAVANNSDGESYGSDATFTTPELSINGLDASTRFPFSGAQGTTVWSTGNITMDIHTNLSGASLSCTDIYLDFKDGIDTDINQNQFSIAVINTSDGSWASVSSVLDVTGNMTIDSTTWASGLSAGWAHGTNPFPIDGVNTTIAVRARVSIPAGKDVGTYTADDWEVTWDY